MKRDDFGVSVSLTDSEIAGVHRAAVSKSIVSTVTVADVYRTALEKEVSAAEKRAAAAAIKQAEREKAQNVTRRLVRVKGNSEYNKIMVEVARRRGTTLGKMLARAVRKHVLSRRSFRQQTKPIENE